MKRQTIFMAAALFFVLVMCGAVSATETQDIGTDVTNRAGTDLGITNSTSPDDALLITTAGSASYKGGTTEDSLQGVVDTTSAITPGNGNLITLNDPNSALEFTFFKKVSSTAFLAKKYTATPSGSSHNIMESSSVSISEDMTQEQWNTAIQQLGPNAFNLISIASAWVNGAPKDLLKIAGYSGGVSEGLISAYAMSKTFVNNYPLAEDDQSYHVIVTPGGGDDDVPMYLMDDTPLKWVNNGKGTPSYYNFHAMNNGNPNENAYIWWDRGATAGKLILWEPNSQNKIAFGSVITGTLSQIKFNRALLGLLTTDPGKLITIENAVQINKADFDHLWEKGIDKAYINLLTPISNPVFGNVLTGSNYNNMKNIGEQAVNLAEAAFGQAINANDLVITSAGYVHIDGKSTSGALDGIISSISGMQLENLMSLKRAPWNTLWFTFVKKGINDALNTVFIKYDAINGLVVVPVNGMNVFDISAANLAGDKGTTGYANSEAVYNAYLANTERPSYSEPHYYIVSLANQWALGIPYNFLTAAIGGGCPGSGLSQGYVITNYVQANLPLGPGQSLITISIPAHCKEQVIMNLLGLTAAKGTYYTLGLQNSVLEPNAAGIFIRWNEATSTGTATLLTLDRNIISALQNQDMPGVSGYYYRTMYWALWYMEHAFPGGDRVAEVNNAFGVKEISITRNDFNALLAAGGDPVAYIKNFVAPVNPPVDPTPEPQPGNQGTGIVSGISNGVAMASASIAQAASGITEHTSAPAEIAPGLPLGDVNPAQTSNASGIPVVPVVSGLLLAAILILVYLGRDSITSAIKGSEKFGK